MEMYKYFDSYKGKKDYQELDNPFIVVIAGLSIAVASILGLLYLVSL